MSRTPSHSLYDHDLQTTGPPRLGCLLLLGYLAVTAGVLVVLATLLVVW